jgi:hypothetical protein
MADDEHLAMLKRGITAWNTWRAANPTVKPDFSRADLRKANLGGLKLSWVSSHSTDVSRRDFKGFDLSWADFSRANLSEANLNWAGLGLAVFRYTDLRGADLHRTSLGGAYFDGADLRGANLTNSRISGTIFANVDLSQVRGLETVIHQGPSSIGLDTIYQSKGKIPEIFLRGSGTGSEFMATIKALAGSIQFYSCFISYSSKDEEFAARLHADLQANEIRCWFAPEDLKIGDKLRPSLDEAIRLHDKLLVVLSENSVRSTWVEKEVETAFEKEIQQNRTVLFPIRLDDSVMETKQAWAADIRRTRYIGDFSGWKRHDPYKRAFERLLRDLKADGKSAAVSK